MLRQKACPETDDQIRLRFDHDIAFRIKRHRPVVDIGRPYMQCGPIYDENLGMNINRLICRVDGKVGTKPVFMIRSNQPAQHPVTYFMHCIIFKIGQRIFRVDDDDFRPAFFPQTFLKRCANRVTCKILRFNIDTLLRGSDPVEKRLFNLVDQGIFIKRRCRPGNRDIKVCGLNCEVVWPNSCVTPLRRIKHFSAGAVPPRARQIPQRLGRRTG